MASSPINFADRCDYYVQVLMKNKEDHSGRFKWKIGTAFEKAVQDVLSHFSVDEIRDIHKIIFDPICDDKKKRLEWAQTKISFAF